MSTIDLTNTQTISASLTLQARQLADSDTDLRKYSSPAMRRIALKSIPSTDLDMAKALGGIFHNQFCYLPEGKGVGSWFAWDGTVWVRIASAKFGTHLARFGAEYLDRVVEGSFTTSDPTGLPALLEAMKNDMDEDAYKATVTPRAKDIRTYANKLRSDSGMGHLENQLCVEMERPSDYFDNDTDFIVFSDGTVRLTSDPLGQTYAPDPARPVSKKLAVSPGQHDTAPQAWAMSLNQWQPNADDQLYLQVAAGAALLGQGNTKNIVCIFGQSNTGKSTYARTLSNVFGQYSATMSPTGIESTMGPNWEQAEARGSRFLLVEEPSKKKTDDSFLKNFAGGGGLVKTQEKGKSPISWRPQAVLHMTSNVKPSIDTGDTGIVQRMNFVEFTHVFAYGQDNPNLDYEDTLYDIAGGAILNWILEGAAKYLELDRIPLSQSIIENTNENVANNSTGIQWAEAMIANIDYSLSCTRLVQLETGAPTSQAMVRSKAHKAYKHWCMTEGLDAQKPADFAKSIEGLVGIKDGKTAKSNGQARVRGFALMHTEDKGQCQGGVACPQNMNAMF